MTAQVIRVAAAQYPIEELTSFSAFESKLARWVQQAVAHGAQILAFPEYAALELSRIGGRHVAGSLHASMDALQYHLPGYEAAHAELARKYGVTILAGSAPTLLLDGRFVNRARLFTPKGAAGFQQKHVLTRFEAEDMGIGASSGLCVFDIGPVRLGIAICYDAGFPLIVRALAEAGAEVLLVPAHATTLSGYYRVRQACAARAIENQIFAVQSCTVGEAAWSAALDVNIGSANVFAPPDRRFPGDGILAQGTLNSPQWVYADLDLELLQLVRDEGDALNFKNWNLQPGALALPKARLVTLD